MADKEQYLSKKYEKWNNFVDSDDEDTADATVVPRVPTQFEVTGDEDIVVSTETFVTPQQIEKLRKLDQPKKEVWQVVVRKLRVWSASSTGGVAADGSDAPPCRPYCILVNNLYPLGQVVSKKICEPPEVYPTPQTILNCVLAAMIDPPTTTTPAHRPEMIAFPDKLFVGTLRKSFAAIGIECSFLTESDGIDSYVRELSNHLVKKDLASVAEVSERPGLSTGAGVTTELLADFYAACAQYAALEPWHRLAERQAIQIDATDDIRLSKNHSAGPGTVFSSVIATKAADANIHGLALFFTRSDLERRVLPPGETLAHLTYPELRRCGFCDQKAVGGLELKRCTRCQCAFYCNSTCQRNHWPAHKLSCVAPGSVAPPPASATNRASASSIQWGAKEISILFGANTTIPFDDLDAIDKNHFVIGTYEQAAYYPTAVVFHHGAPDVPDASSIAWLTRALHAMSALLKNHPQFMQTTLADFVDSEETHKAQPTIDVETTTSGVNEHLVVRNSTVLTAGDVDKIRNVIAQQKEANAAKANDSDAEGRGGSDDKSCIVM